MAQTTEENNSKYWNDKLVEIAKQLVGEAFTSEKDIKEYQALSPAKALSGYIFIQENFEDMVRELRLKVALVSKKSPQQKDESDDEKESDEEELDDVKCYWCNARGVDKKVNGVWIHEDCE